MRLSLAPAPIVGWQAKPLVVVAVTAATRLVVPGIGERFREKRQDLLKSGPEKSAGRGGTGAAVSHSSPPPQRREGSRMPTAAPDRDDRQPDPVHTDPPADDTGLHDIFELWRDLGGSD